MTQLANFDFDDVEDEDEDLGTCPYFLYYNGWGPQATCFQLSVCEYAMGNPEPCCVTCEPSEGWPSQRRAFAFVWFVTLAAFTTETP